MNEAVVTPRMSAFQRRAFWTRQLQQWHWISSALCLTGMLLFSITGLTLNHAADIEAVPQVEQRTAELPPALRTLLNSTAREARAPLLPSISDWLRTTFAVEAADVEPEWSETEVYLALPRPGGDAWVSIDLGSGQVEYENTSRGWISYLNDLHKGRNTGSVWRGFIDVFAIASLVFCITGLCLLQLHSARRPATWPMVGLGLASMLLLTLLFIH